MIERLLNVFAVFGPVVLAGMGIFIALWPPNPDGNARYYWLGAFIAIGLASAIGTYRVSISKSDLSEMILGGEHFCYFKIRPTDAANLEGPFQLWMIAPDGPVYDLNSWISPASAASASDPAYGSLDVRKPLVPIVHEGGHAWDKTLPLGEYLIEFDAKNGHWNEVLRIFVRQGKLTQSIRVVGFGHKLLYEEREIQ